MNPAEILEVLDSGATAETLAEKFAAIYNKANRPHVTTMVLGPDRVLLQDTREEGLAAILAKTPGGDWLVEEPPGLPSQQLTWVGDD